MISSRWAEDENQLFLGHFELQDAVEHMVGAGHQKARCGVVEPGSS
jgi:hypothetical protein